MKPATKNTRTTLATPKVESSSIRKQWSKSERELRRQLALRRQAELLLAVLGGKGPWILGR